MVKYENGHYRSFCQDCDTEIFESMGFTYWGDFLFILLWTAGKVTGPCTLRQLCGKCALKKSIEKYGRQKLLDELAAMGTQT